MTAIELLVVLRRSLRARSKRGQRCMGAMQFWNFLADRLSRRERGEKKLKNASHAKTRLPPSRRTPTVVRRRMVGLGGQGRSERIADELWRQRCLCWLVQNEPSRSCRRSVGTPQ
uniref:Secreted protein n=1 Tax=Plectus sambesii TaxID=2011161 RepID=A0A914V6L5_9BILA